MKYSNMKLTLKGHIKRMSSLTERVKKLTHSWKAAEAVNAQEDRALITLRRYPGFAFATQTPRPVDSANNQVTNAVQSLILIIGSQIRASCVPLACRPCENSGDDLQSKIDLCEPSSTASVKSPCVLNARIEEPSEYAPPPFLIERQT